jgi:hypothetical protein|tara:strand:- start:557 stop:886 length:330 start_codon:yes stop_codon:yes gene_type:complete
MTKTFINQQNNIIFQIDVDNTYGGYWTNIIVSFLMTHHNDVFSEIDYHEGGSVSMTDEKDEIQVWGDNGLIIFEAIEIPLLTCASDNPQTGYGTNLGFIEDYETYIGEA